ncbi:MAG: sulfurtransferase TusA family protein [Candidatus Binatia bacterium]|nr:sulfurtransferase TusA family protein [Candidatus Binatia bacterium]
MNDPSRGQYSNEPYGNNAEVYDLRGVRCPMNWVRAKVRLEQLPIGAILCLRLDDPKGAAELPRAAEAEGYAVLEICHDAQANEWHIVIQK